MRKLDQFRTKDKELEDEVSFHIEQETKANIARGMTSEEARRQAIVAFGGVSQTKETLRSMSLASVWERTVQDVRFGARILLKTPVISALMLLIFAIGIGSTTAFFSVVNAVLLRPLPYPNPEQIVTVRSLWRGQPGGVSVGNWHDWKEQSSTLEALAATQSLGFTLGMGDVPERFIGAKVTWDYFQVFNTQPILGRVFGKEEDQPGRDDVVVLSYGLWRDRFGANSNIIGTTMQIDQRPRRIIGVMPQYYDPVGDEDQFWLPAAFTDAQLKEHDEHFLFTAARLKSGVTLQQARSELEVIGKRMAEAFPKDNRERTVTAVPLKDLLVEDYRPSLLLMLGATVFLLLIACANIANLQLARSAARQREIAMRSALGASPARIVRQLLAESLTLSCIGGLLGIAVAYAATNWLMQRMPGGAPRLHEAGLEPGTLLFCLAVTLACGLLCGIVPAVRSRSLYLSRSLNQSGGTAAKSHRDWVRTGIVVVQTSLTVMLLAGAALLLKSANNLNHQSAGFDPTNVISARVPLSGPEYQTPLKMRQTFLSILDEVRRIPGVSSVALDSRVPMSGGSSNGLLPEGRSMNEPGALVQSRMQIVSSEIFGTLRIPLKNGRTFKAEDRNGAPKVMVINEALAKLAFPGQSAVGKRIACCEMGADGRPGYKEVIGVVGDLRSQGIDQAPVAEFYLPLEQAPDDAWRWVRGSLDLVVRGENNPAPLANDIRRIVARAAPGTPVTDVATMEERIVRSVEQSRFITMLLTMFSAVALLLASVGIYGVLSYSVSQRSREIGIRMAIGAQRGDVRKMVVKQGMKLTAIGLCAGIVGALATTRLITSMLFQVKPTDPIVLAAVVSVLCGIALVASYLPARKASAVDPMVAFRAD